MKFLEVDFTYISNATETARKITTNISFSLEFESFKSVKYSLCYEYSKVGTFSGSPGRITVIQRHTVVGLIG